MGREGDHEARPQTEEEDTRKELSESDDGEVNGKSLLDRWIHWSGVVDR